MGLFDIFTGDSAKKAAEENKKNLAAAKAEDTATLNAASTNAQGVLDTAAGYYSPLAAKYGQASNLALDALGVNGAQGNANAVNAFHAGPGYNWMVDQSLEGVKRAANASGDPLGGNTLAALSDRAGNLANQEYGNWLTRLQGYVQPELSATGGQAGYTAAKAPVITGTANNIVGIDQNTVKGINDQNTQAANASIAGSGNLWGLGLNLAKLGLSGGTSLLGSGGSGPITLGSAAGPTPFY